MQTCSLCHTQSVDSALICSQCQADLREYSETAVARKNFQENSRVTMIRVQVGVDACPACQEVRATYAKETVPTLPVEGCSCEYGCRCFYEPVLDEIYP